MRYIVDHEQISRTHFAAAIALAEGIDRQKQALDDWWCAAFGNEADIPMSVAIAPSLAEIIPLEDDTNNAP